MDLLKIIEDNGYEFVSLTEEDEKTAMATSKETGFVKRISIYTFSSLADDKFDSTIETISSKKKAMRGMHTFEFFVHRSEQQTDKNNYIFIVNDIYENGSLEDYIKKEGPFRNQNLIYFAKELISQLIVIHDNHIAHGDFLPSNIMIDRALNPVFVDFGIKKLFESYEDSCEDICYRAPETQYRKVYDPIQADIYSLGVILYFIAVGTLPWMFKDSESIIKAQALGRFTVPPDIDQRYANLIKKLLDRNPETRPSIAQISKYHLFRSVPQKTPEEVKEIDATRLIDFKRRSFTTPADSTSLVG